MLLPDSLTIINAYMRIMGLAIPGATSGADTAIFSRLRSRGFLIDVIPVEMPRWVRTRLLVTTFKPSRRRWGNAWYGAMTKSPTAFRARTVANHRHLTARAADFDVVLQISGLFAPFVGRAPVPVAIFCDYTTKLAERNYEPWFGLTTKTARQWYDLENELYRSAALLLTASDNTRRSLTDDYGVPADRVRVVGEGVEAIRESDHGRYATQTILFVGIDFVRKGGPTLLDAFQYVRRAVPNARLEIAGPPQPPGPAIEGVTWHGHVGDQDMLRSLFNRSSLLVLPSLCEPFGLALIEGMAHGLPVVGTRVDAMPEIIDDGLNGYLVAAGDPIALAERLVTLLGDPAMCARMGAHGRAKVQRQFLWDHVVDRTVHALSTLAP